MIDLFFLPRRCLVCGADRGPDPLCLPCQARLMPHSSLTAGGLCPLCGQVRLAEADTCVDCSSARWSFTSVDGLYGYHDASSELLRLYKFGGLASLASFWAPLAAARLVPPAPLVPVPPLRRHLWRRGWDPVAHWTRQVARQAGVPVWRPLVRRASASQKSLGRPARSENARKAYALSRWASRALVGVPLVWLVDDVVTTGATIEACAALLRQAGVVEVRVICVVLH